MGVWVYRSVGVGVAPQSTIRRKGTLSRNRDWIIFDRRGPRVARQQARATAGRGSKVVLKVGSLWFNRK